MKDQDHSFIKIQDSYKAINVDSEDDLAEEIINKGRNKKNMLYSQAGRSNLGVVNILMSQKLKDNSGA